MKKALVTGAGGFLGRALVKKLLSDGYAVRAVDNNTRGNLETIKELKQVELIKGDILNYQDALQWCDGVEEVFHLAAINGTKNFYEIPQKVLEVGVIGTHNLTKAALETKAKRLIFASTSEVYNTPSIVPTPEQEVPKIPDIFNARFSYAGGKLAGELIVVNYLRGTNTNFTIFRPHNVIGPQMGFEHVIPNFVEKIFKAHKKSSGKKQLDIEIQGSGTETRSFIFVDDASDAILTATRGGGSELYHIGNEDEHTIIDLLKTVGNSLGFEINAIAGEMAKGSPIRRCPNTEKIRALGFKSKYDFAGAVKKTSEWYWDFYSKKQDN
jgi:UDP-glucose 4-epimerase